MSGIVGIVNLEGAPVDRQLLRQITDFLAYRGPDAQEIWVAGQTVPGVRLSISSQVRTATHVEYAH